MGADHSLKLFYLLTSTPCSEAKESSSSEDVIGCYVRCLSMWLSSIELLLRSRAQALNNSIFDWLRLVGRSWRC
jgi:hypothetical protein